MKLKVYKKKVIDFVWENMMTSFLVADGPSYAPKNSVIIFSHTKAITYNCYIYRLETETCKTKILVLHKPSSRYVGYFVLRPAQKKFHLHQDVTITGEGCKIYASVFPVSSEGPLHFVASYDTQGNVEDLF
jgi:hypothetical protein